MESSALIVVISSRAQKEIALSWQWYEEREPELGDRFVAAVRQKIGTISKDPEIFAIKHKPYREASVSVFPFLIIYKVNKRQRLVEIISVFHTARNPKRKY